MIILKIVIGLVLLGMWICCVEGHECWHDSMEPQRTQIIETKYENHPFESTDPSGKRVIAGQSYDDIRVTFYTDQLDTDLDSQPTKLSFIKDELIPDMTLELKELLGVIRVSGNLLMRRTCLSRFSSGECASFADPYKCGEVTVPTEHIMSEPECPSNPWTCEDTTGGDGIPNTDLLIYLTAQDYGGCVTGNTLAFASHCTRDQYDRPLSGYVNFCADTIDVNNFESAKMTFLHEITHILGIARNHFAFFRKTDGTPRTARNDFGFPPWNSGYVANENTVKEFTERGHKVQKLVTEVALEKVREHFDCSDLNGLEIESLGGSGTAGSHLDQRIFNSEYMCGVIHSHPVLSPLSLAVLADSNWYRVDFTKAKRLSWGRRLGCNFALDKCLQKSGDTTTSAFPDHFCTVHGSMKCTQNLLARGYCNVLTYTSDLPSIFQYFTDARRGGQVTMDYCPAFALYNDNGKLTDCRFPANTPTNNWRGEIYSSASRCVDNTLRSSGSANSFGGGCYQINCDNAPTSVQISVDSEVVTCSTSDEGNTKTVSGFHGSLVCPVVSDICPSANEILCDNIVCFEGECNTANGKCDCNSDWYGEFCDITKCFGVFSNESTVCSSHGLCNVHDSCTCSNGYTGDDCEYKACNSIPENDANVCNGRGICQEINKCNCTVEGYFGDDCEQFKCGTYDSNDSGVCSGKGECTDPDVCECDDGFTGDFCSCKDVNDCYCLGVNETLPDGEIPCNCTDGWTGDNCDVPICFDQSGSEACSGPNGECVSPDKCTCTTAWIGDDCSTESVCEEFDFCNNRGVCTQGLCVCQSRFNGDSCQYHYCFQVSSGDSNVCSGHGSCSSTDTCVCDSGYEEDDCSVHTCDGVPYTDTIQVCSGHGSCVDVDECQCTNTSRYTGTTCEVAFCYGKPSDDPEVCSGRGTCSYFNECQCDEDDDGFGKVYIGNECEKYECPNRCPDRLCNQETGRCLDFDEKPEVSSIGKLEFHWISMVFLFVAFLYL